MHEWNFQMWECYKETYCDKYITLLQGGEFAFMFGHPFEICELDEEVGATMTQNIETKRDEASGASKVGIWRRKSREIWRLWQ